MEPITYTIVQTMQRLLFPDRPPPAVTLFHVIVREDRSIVIVDPKAVEYVRRPIDDKFSQRLSYALQGRRVRRTTLPNQRGIILQVSHEQEAIAQLESHPLDLTLQPSPVHVPLGVSRRGDMWIDIIEGDSYLIGGSRGMGKTTLLHAWIQSLLHGGEVRLRLWDGKNGAEFSRYSNNPNCFVDASLEAVIGLIMSEMRAREADFSRAGVPSISQWNEKHTPYPPLVFMVDEAAFMAEMAESVKDIIARGRAFGIHPVLATQRTGTSEIQALSKTNLITRIAFPVPAVHDSMVILGRRGADKLPKKKGRLLVSWKARDIEVQAYSISLPTVDSLWPQGEDLALMQRATAEADGKVSIEMLKFFGLTEAAAKQRLVDWREKGWVVKDGKRNNATYLTTEIMGRVGGFVTGVDAWAKVTP